MKKTPGGAQQFVLTKLPSRFQCNQGLRTTELRGKNHAIPMRGAHMKWKIKVAALMTSMPHISTSLVKKKKNKTNKQENSC